MSIPIPIAMDYSASLEGSTVKAVVCEQCGQEYVYIAVRKAGGKATSFLFIDNHGAKQRAEGRAADRLDKELARAVEPVPCVSCGWLQKDMVIEARHRRLRILFVGGIVIAFISLCVMLIAVVMGAVLRNPPVVWGSAAGIAVGVGMVILQAVAMIGYDPNRTEAKYWTARIGELAMSRVDFNAMMEGKGEQELEAARRLADRYADHPQARGGALASLRSSQDGRRGY